MEQKTINQLKFLKGSVIILFLLNGFLLFSSFNREDKKEKFKELDVDRLNIMGVNGKPVIVLSNKMLIPGPAMNGKTYPREYADGRENFSGIIFFNEEGDEVGGLLFNGMRKDSGYYALEHFSFDQWKQNQVVAMQYIDNGKSRRSGLRIWDRPSTVQLDEIFDRFKARNEVPKNSKAYDSITNEIKASSARGDNGVERMFIGSLNDEAQIQLKDKKGNIRARLYIDPNGEARLDFMDEKGTVIKSFGK